MTGRNLMEHDPDAQLVHAINYQLIDILFGECGELTDLLVNRDSWIINVLYLSSGPDSTSKLRTSATQHRGKLYRHDLAPARDVMAIDEVVPLATSVCGRCLLSGRPIWLGRPELEPDEKGFGEKFYRRFSLVDVNTSGQQVPRAEIAFPISHLNINNATAFGVLNLELFGETPDDLDAFMANIPKELVSQLLCDLLHVHAGLLKVAIDVLQLRPCKSESVGKKVTSAAAPLPYVENIVALHKAALDLFLERYRREVDYVVGVLQKFTP